MCRFAKTLKLLSERSGESYLKKKPDNPTSSASLHFLANTKHPQLFGFCSFFSYFYNKTVSISSIKKPSIIPHIFLSRTFSKWVHFGQNIKHRIQWFNNMFSTEENGTDNDSRSESHSCLDVFSQQRWIHWLMQTTTKRSLSSDLQSSMKREQFRTKMALTNSWN